MWERTHAALLDKLNAAGAIARAAGGGRRQPHTGYSRRSYPGPSPVDAAERAPSTDCWSTPLASRELWARGVKPVITRRNTDNGSGVGTVRRVVERTPAQASLLPAPTQSLGTPRHRQEPFSAPRLRDHMPALPAPLPELRRRCDHGYDEAWPGRFVKESRLAPLMPSLHLHLHIVSSTDCRAHGRRPRALHRREDVVHRANRGQGLTRVLKPHAAKAVRLAWSRRRWR